MGYMVHHAIVITSFDEKKLKAAHNKVKKIRSSYAMTVGNVGCWLSPISPATTNDYRSFFIAPDGSEAGWAESDKGDRLRNEVIEMLDSFAYADGSNSLKYAEVQYGDDENRNYIIRANRCH